MDSFRLQIKIRGAVQGVGFRPFIFRLATEMGLRGWVSNSSQGVFVECEGQKEKLDSFLLRIEKEKPSLSFIQSLEYSFLDPVGYEEFEIRLSKTEGETTALVLPDIATCPDCLREIFDPSNRRYLYPFTNCTNCGPRFTIIESLPYDRPNTAMKFFQMCSECRDEYENPRDRRFHAQPNACPKCGPHIELWNASEKILCTQHDALLQSVTAICEGKIVAVKGLGGFHLMVDARNEKAIARLRERKHREEKPFALMYPSLDSIRTDCIISKLEERLLLSPESPIVLLKRKPEIDDAKNNISSIVAPNNPYLGVMLPYTPLHQLMMKELNFPVVATSGNLSDEPICTDEHEAVERLGNITDMFLIHNRPIVRHVDDSIVRVIMDREMVIRRARGYAPLPIQVKNLSKTSMLAVGAHLKNNVALTSGENVFISQHIGDLETKEAFTAFQNVIDSFQQLYKAQPELVVCDKHPDYLSTKYAKSLDASCIDIQHHYAHVASCMAENQLDENVLGVSWDGTGFGLDGTIWGGEFLLTDSTSFKRVATFRQFKLPGGEQAIKEPRRAALGILYQIFGNEIFEHVDLIPVQSFTQLELGVMRTMLRQNVNSPITSSVGRLFDAVSSLIGLRQRVKFEGQAAMELEFALERASARDCYPFFISTRDSQNQKSTSENRDLNWIVDWESLITEILKDQKQNLDRSNISKKFHNTLTKIIIDIAERAGEKHIVLTGGCFQNRYLLDQTVQQLMDRGFHPYWHQRVPPNDGGISLGQIYAVARMQSNANIKQQK
jgi:hydrogenase maturation protein HypF